MSEDKSLYTTASDVKTADLPGEFGVGARIEKHLKEAAKILQEHLDEENKTTGDECQKGVEMSIRIDGGRVFVAYIAKETNNKTGDIIISDRKKSLPSATTNLGVKKDKKILGKHSFS